MKYQTVDSIYLGTVDLRISTVFELFPEFFQGCAMLINCVDSSSDLNWTDGPDSIRLKKWGVEIFKGKLCVPEIKIKEVFDDGNTFNGFDEVYLFHEWPKSVPKYCFTSDRTTFKEQIPNEFLSYFKESGAIRYLSDGVGLNFACESKVFVERLGILEERNK